ncbi:hemoglobin/transferrin/lactoferrin receptor protein [Humitalea rosea]|uniref:Hemoglobin/transferrin/lactoferrin receptor protein n=1 Tax=Humitalea rosea TaxID=990373 RepID=A0A2W7J5W6_9PROT|nr:TonB-dependent hemoglobin/transferrin/lactoferrin family receptor [Humitalea rosea]PZW46512.1 hemoglobin/transferrin/lactoferrin receptor protein [Humitalea rosea]
MAYAPSLRRLLLATTCLVLSAPLAGAQTAPDATVLAPVAVTATRGEQSIDAVPATVSVITADQLDRQNAVRPQDAIRYEPGVSFGNQPARAGGTNFTIRGIGDNRVRVQVDGVRLPDFPGSNVGAGTYTRDFVDLESVRRIEIVRGPASALYGSDAIGGVVAYILKDPADYLAGRDSNTYFSTRFGYNGADNSFTETLTGAMRADNIDAMLLYTRRDGHEVRPNGNLSANPQDYTVNNVLGRIVIHGREADALRLTGEFFQRDTDTDIRSERTATRGAAVLDSQGDDRTQRGRFTVDYTRESPIGIFDRLEARAWYTRLDRTENTVQTRSTNTTGPLVPTRLRVSDFEFEQEIVGGEVQFGNRLTGGGFEHRLTYGVTVERTTSTRPRDRTETNLDTGVTTRTISGETYPNKNFPDTATVQGGLYLQDEMTAGRLTITPGLRLDYYNLRPDVDAAFSRSAQSAAAQQVQNMDELALSPKLGAVLRLDEVFSLYGQYAHGFRAPAYDNVNFGFTNRVFGYEILPSGDLQPETSDGVEIGLRGRTAGGSNFQVAGFYNHYSDFIETAVVGNAGGLTQYQYRNLSSVTIYGAEARGEYRMTPQWSLRASTAYAHGEDNDTKLPIDSVDPWRFVGGVAWQHESGVRAEANVTHSLRNNRTSSDTAFHAPSYTVLDLAVSYDYGPNLTVNAGLFNVTDAKYFNSQDVIGLAANSQQRDLYAQPGRYAAVNVTYRW